MKPEGEDWITANEAADILHILPRSVRRLARSGQLDAIKTGTTGCIPTMFFSRQQILARAGTRSQKRRASVRRQKSERQERVTARLEDYPPQDWITVREAAEILRCSRSQILNNIYGKRLLSLQNLPGQNGSDHRLSREQVEAYRDSPARLKRVATYYQRKPIYVAAAQERAEDADPEPMSPWITTDQIVHWLGVSAATVHKFRESGRVFFRTVGLRPHGWVYQHSKDDVKKLISDPEYQKRSTAAYKGYINRLNKQINICADVTARHRTNWLDHPLPPQDMW